jgi:RimJ/RimL family protein N-acetyltransferase
VPCEDQANGDCVSITESHWTASPHDAWTRIRKEPDLRATYLTGDRLYLRAMVHADKEHSTAWFDSPFPIDSTRAERFLKEEHKNLSSSSRHLIIALRETDEIVGRLNLFNNGREANIWFTMAPWREDADRLQAEALKIAIPWLRDEATMVTTDVEIAADLIETIASAEELGMVRSVRLREHIARPGYRVDVLIYQALGPAWSFGMEAVDA